MTISNYYHCLILCNVIIFLFDCIAYDEIIKPANVNNDVFIDAVKRHIFSILNENIKKMQSFDLKKCKANHFQMQSKLSRKNIDKRAHCRKYICDLQW